MVAATPCDVRGRLRQRSNPEPTGGSPESNQPHVLSFGASDSGPRMTGLFGTSNMLAWIADRHGRQPAARTGSKKMTAKEDHMGKLEGKIALVTGGNSGIGLATAKQFVNEGAHVFITGRREPELAAAVKEIGRNVTGVQGDVANLDDLDRLFAQIKSQKGKLDIVFANAGVARLAPFGTISEEHFDSLFNINEIGRAQ